MQLILVVTCLIFLASFSNCGATKDSAKQDTIKAIKINYSLPLLAADSTVFQDDQIDVIYYYKDIIIHEVRTVYDSVVLETDQNGKDVERSVKWEIRHKYFVYKQNETYGYKYDSLNAMEGEKKTVKAFNGGRVITQLDSLGILTLQKDSLVERVKRGNTVLEKYIPRNKRTIAFSDSTFLYFTTDPLLRSSNFALSKSADNIRKMKLYKLKMVYNDNPNTTDIYGKQARYFSFEFDTIKVKNKEAIIKLAERLPAYKHE